MKDIIDRSLDDDIARFFEEDDLSRNLYYISSLPDDQVECSLNLKSDLVVAGLPYFFKCFKYLGASSFDEKKLMVHEGVYYRNKEQDGSNPLFTFNLPFAIALTGERIALNLLQRASSVATLTRRFVEKCALKKIKILDTRKTTPGLRALEKYAVRVGGGFNHRFGQTDLWMVKDNHKTFFGGIGKAIEFFRSIQGLYVPLEVEVTNLEELKEAIECGVSHIMLDNFSPEMVVDAVELKKSGLTYEVSGGIRMDNIDQYLIKGIDAISIGQLTNNPQMVDISFKYSRGR